MLSRRSLLAALGVGGPAALVAAAIAEAGSAEASDTAVRPSPRFPSLVSPLAQENLLLRMQDDLKRAMAKPIEQRRWIMVIDQEKCVGCSACTIACIAENHLPPGVVYRPVIDEEIGEYPNVRRRFLPRPCMQCADPPCVPVCPVDATYKRPDGVVEIDYKRCIGCRYCVPACPYGARTFDFGANYSDDTPAKASYELIPSPEYGKSWEREGERSPIGNVRKCQFCVHRTEAGMLPACVTTCIGHATYFGDKNDENSLVSELISSPRVMRLLEELGTEPGVYYLM
ncbi:MAG: 4Fe-4S dicluster domain-containing protein [Chloroflexi bacterium]|nr:4Fe-4S dicluster domain-containing protein [Chloroflexota bacterium]